MAAPIPLAPPVTSATLPSIPALIAILTAKSSVGKALRHQRVVPGDHHARPARAEFLDQRVGLDHLAQVDDDAERPLELEFLVEVGGVGGEDHRPVDDDDLLARRVTADGDHAHAGNDLLVRAGRAHAVLRARARSTCAIACSSVCAQNWALRATGDDQNSSSRSGT